MAAHREGVWTGHNETPCLPGPDWRRAAREGAVLSGAAALVAGAASWVGLALPAGTIVLGMGALGLMGRHRDDRRRAERERTWDLREEFGVGPVWPVELMVRQGEAPTGCDRGLMWVEGDRILYAGLRTSFALAPAQTGGPVVHGPRLAGIRHRLNLPLARETPVGPLSLSFWPLSEGLLGAQEDAANLRVALNTVAGRRDHVLEALGQWPPLAIGPDAPTPRDLLLGALARVVGWTLFALVPAVALGAHPLFALAAFVVVAGLANWAAAYENAPRWRAYRDRRRLRRAS